MKRNRISEEKLKDVLQQMPAMKDKQDPDDLYEKISSRLQEPEKKSFISNKQWLVPSLASIAVVIILIVISPSLFNNNSSQDQAADMNSMNKSSAPEMMHPSNDTKMDTADNNDTKERNQDNFSIAQDSNNPGIAGIQAIPQTHTVQQISDQTELVTAVLPDLQNQYLVPISFLFPKEQRSLQEHYNQLKNYIQADQWGLDDSILKNVNFELLPEERTVKVKINNDFQLSQGSSAQYVFLNSLKETFRPQGFETLEFEKDGSKGIELSQYGYLEKTSIKSVEKQVYKIYQADESKPVFLVTIPVDSTSTFKDAIEVMKEDEPTFHVKGTIPPQVEFDQIVEGTDVLTISFTDETQIVNTQEFVNMFDALLMTAKSYGYQQVHFKNADLEHIGPYQLSGLIEVPEAVNSMQILVNLEESNQNLEQVK